MICPQLRRIALCLEFPIHLRGGVSVIVEELIKGLSSRYQLVLVSQDKCGALRETSLASVPLEHISWIDEKASIKSARALADLLQAHNIQLAHFHGGVYSWGARSWGYSPIPYLKKMGIPSMTTVHLVVSLLDGYCGPQKPLWFKLGVFPLAWMSKMHVLYHSQKEIAVSKHDFRSLRSWYRPFNNKFRHVYHSRIKLTETIDVTRKPIILSVGHVAYRKGQHLLASAFSQIAQRHSEWKLIIAGHDSGDGAWQQIEFLSAKHKLENRILFMGELKDPVPLMREASIFVQPSIHEALGLALQEALYYGCACIGSRAGGIPELIEHEQNGLLVASGDVQDLRCQLERLINDSALRNRLSSCSRESVLQKQMTVDQMIQQHVEIYDSIIG